MLAPRNKLHSTPRACVAAGLKMLGVEESDTLFDIGCGDGRVLVEAAEAHRCTCIGVDLNPTRVEEARAAVASRGLDAHVTVVEGNALELDYSTATCIFMFLIKRGLRIMRRILNDLMASRRATDPDAPPIRVVSYLYRIPDVKPQQVQWVTLPDKPGKYPLYLYSFPVQVAAKPKAAAAGAKVQAGAAAGEADSGAGGGAAAVGAAGAGAGGGAAAASAAGAGARGGTATVAGVTSAATATPDARRDPDGPTAIAAATGDSSAEASPK